MYLTSPESFEMTLRWVWARLALTQRGETTEKVIITALFAALALAAGTIITVKVTKRAESIPIDAQPATPAVGSGTGVLGQ